MMSEKDAELKQLHYETKQLLLRQHQLEVLHVRSLLTAGRVTLRGVLEHVFKTEGFGTGEAEIVKLMRTLDSVVGKCSAEDTIEKGLRGQGTRKNTWTKIKADNTWQPTPSLHAHTPSSSHAILYTRSTLCFVESSMSVHRSGRCKPSFATHVQGQQINVFTGPETKR